MQRRVIAPVRLSARIENRIDQARYGVRQSQDFLGLDDAMKALATFDERKSRVIELRFFGGLTVEETASVLKTRDARERSPDA